MMNVEIQNRIVMFLKEDPFYKETLPKSFNEDFNLLDSGVLDSIGILNLIVFLEAVFHISVAIEELSEKNFLNINRIVKFIELKNSTK